ncbi:MAG: GIY-YIG nuclease family protein [Spirochaetes bacterium]|nr:GIY-YIG nuclease family protein [Spirochaetota bacterium]
MADKGIVYILTNPCLDGWVKIGKSDKNDIAERLYDLNRHANLPLSFRAYAVYRVENPGDVEKAIHGLIDKLQPDFRAKETLPNGKSRTREFFKMPPDMALSLFKEIALSRGDAKNLELIKLSKEEQEEEAIAGDGAVDEDEVVTGDVAVAGKRQPKLVLKDIGIPDGAELSFLYSDAITCKADINENKLVYEGKAYSSSALALKLLTEKYGWTAKSVSGSQFFKYNGQTLAFLRRQKQL